MLDINNYVKFLGSYRRFVILICVPILLLLPVSVFWLSTRKETVLCGYVGLIMAIYWASEVIPLAVTAFIPLFAFPLLGIQSAKAVAGAYVQDISFLFIGGLIFGIAVEEVLLHRRIALSVLLIVGEEPGRLLAGVMATTAFLSMWISNVAATSMMVPVVLSLVSELIRTERSQSTRRSRSDDHWPDLEQQPMIELGANSNTDFTLSSENLSSKDRGLCKAMLLAICYSATIGGLATLIGTPTNIILTGLLTGRYGNEHPVNFTTWILYSFPGMAVTLFAAWCWLQIMFLGPRTFLDSYLSPKKKFTTRPNLLLKQSLQRELLKLGPISFAEWSVICWFLVLLLLWLTRSLVWGDFFRKLNIPYVSDGTSAILIAFILFVWPKRLHLWKNMNSFESETILNWKTVEKRLPWGVVILLGGGFALGSAVESTGLSAQLGNKLSRMNFSKDAFCRMSLVLTSLFTEFTSNAAVTNIFLPIVMSVADNGCINPLYLAVPAGRAASFAFMLPVATPANAVVFSAAEILKVGDMIKAGLVMKCICIFEALLSVDTWGWSLFGLNAYPAWAAKVSNRTCLK